MQEAEPWKNIDLDIYLESPSRTKIRRSSVPFKDGEEIIYDVEYKMGKSWVSAGKARFLVKDSVFNNQSCYYVEGKGKSLKNYDWFFIDDFDQNDDYGKDIIRRFIGFIDIAYIEKVKIKFFLNNDDIRNLYSGEELSFLWDRTISRLEEMRDINDK